MSKIAAAGSFSPSIKKQLLLNCSFTTGETTWKKKQWGLQWYPSRSSRQIKNQISVQNPATYSSSMSTDIALYESPGASFDSYLEDKPRVFQAMFPDKQRSQQLTQEEWRIQMLPINFLFLTVWPTVDVRLSCRNGGRDYPPHIKKVMELEILRWELKGLDGVIEPSHFSLGVKGALYADRGRTRTRLKGKLEMEISFVLPPVLALVPEDVRNNVAETVLSTLVYNMKHKVNSSLLSDYSRFKAEKA
ncbi:Uncharacterized protein SYNPCC7002_A1590 [Linum perenne]